LIEVEGVSRSFAAARPALSDVTFDVPGGSVTGLLGPNGAGKTTLFRILAGILRPDAGRVTVCGYDTAGQPARARALVGLLTEEAGLPGRLTPLWHVALHATLRGQSRNTSLMRARRLLESLGAGEAIERPHATLSKGTRAKVALARALVHEPPAVLLDEPTANLDMETSRQLRRFILERARSGCASLVATHNPAEAEELCERFVILGEGRVLAAGSLAMLRERAGCPSRLEARLSGPAHLVTEKARRIARGAAVRTRDDWIVFTMTDASTEAGSSVGPTASELVAAAAPLEILELRRRDAPLEEIYRRLQERAT